jgi:hypothetical protein
MGNLNPPRVGLSEEDKVHLLHGGVSFSTLEKTGTTLSSLDEHSRTVLPCKKGDLRKPPHRRSSVNHLRLQVKAFITVERNSTV